MIVYEDWQEKILKEVQVEVDKNNPVVQKSVGVLMAKLKETYTEFKVISKGREHYASLVVTDKPLPDRCLKCGSPWVCRVEDGLQCVHCGFIYYQR